MTPTFRVIAMLLAASGVGCVLQGCGGTSRSSDAPPSHGGTNQPPGSGGASTLGSGGLAGTGARKVARVERRGPRGVQSDRRTPPTLIGVYGMSADPCVENYIVDDSFNAMPIKPSNATNKGTAEIDGGTHVFYTVRSSSTTSCGGGSGWMQVYSIRQTARQCGHISISKHSAEWAKSGMPLGKLEEAMVFVEAGGGVGSIDFTTVRMTAE